MTNTYRLSESGNSCIHSSPQYRYRKPYIYHGITPEVSLIPALFNGTPQSRGVQYAARQVVSCGPPHLFHINKGKSVPLQAWSGPQGSRKLWYPDFMTTAQDGGKVVSLTHRPPLPPGNAPGYSFLLETESAPRP